MRKKILKDVLKKNRAALAVFLIIEILNAAIFLLYDIMTEAFLYASAVSLLLLVAFCGFDYYREKKKAGERENALAAILSDRSHLPETETLSEADYQSMITVLGNELERVTAEAESGRREMIDYYTTWVHQIKTPIAVMKLKLSDDTPENRALQSELFRIEQYVDMVLQYIRIESTSTDLVIKEYRLDDIIKEVVRKYSGQFIEKRLKLEYAGTDEVIVTDKKWFSVILEQLVSNAVKYTHEGCVTIKAEDGVLRISDTGIGIAPEDLPRIFDKGFTGMNGRLNEKSSGLGLYLAGRAASLLNVKLHAESTPGSGTTFTVDYEK